MFGSLHPSKRRAALVPSYNAKPAFSAQLSRGRTREAKNLQLAFEARTCPLSGCELPPIETPPLEQEC